MSVSGAFGELALLETGQKGSVPGLRRDGAVADDVAGRFGDEYYVGDQERCRADGEEPEDCSPAEELCKESSNHGAYCWAEHDPGADQTHVGASFGRR